MMVSAPEYGSQLHGVDNAKNDLSEPCTESKAPPIIDATFATIYTVMGVGSLISQSTEKRSNQDPQDESVVDQRALSKVAGPAALLFAGIFGAASFYGFTKSEQCQQYQEMMRQLRFLDELNRRRDVRKRSSESSQTNTDL